MEGDPKPAEMKGRTARRWSREPLAPVSGYYAYKVRVSPDAVWDKACLSFAGGCFGVVALASSIACPTLLWIGLWVLGPWGLIPLFALAVAAVWVGVWALLEMRKSDGHVRGKFFAVAGIGLGACTFLVTFCFSRAGLFSFDHMTAKSSVSEVKDDMRTLGTAIESYRNDHRSYPAWGIGAGGPGGTVTHNHWVSQLQEKSEPPASLPTFLLYGRDKKQRFATLTTPVNYVRLDTANLFIAGSPTVTHNTAYPIDHFGGKIIHGSTYVYWSIEWGRFDPSGKIVGGNSAVGGAGWILVSPGPDQVYDLPGDWEAYNPILRQPSERLLTGTNRHGYAFTYDPTNGLFSRGDIWRVKQ